MNECVYSTRTPDPLDAVAVAATLDGVLATCRVTHRFRNVEATPIEAVFTFPIPYGATLVGVEAELAGKALSSVAMPKRAAENAYEDAVSSGDSAILVEEASPGLHCVSLGNLAPGEMATLAFTYALLLEGSDDRLTLRFPTAIAPRYGRPEMREHAAPIAAFDLVRRADLTLTVRRAAAGVEGAITSPTHALAVSRSGDDVVVRPAQGSVEMDRDIVIELRGAFQPTAIGARDGDGYVAFASFQARDGRKGAAQARVLKILVDRSGSMVGDSIAQARQALVAILQSLRPDDRFSVVGFGSSVAFMTEGLVAASPATVADALARAASMEADLGGTEMRSALVKTFAQPLPRGATGADVLLITDGGSWDERGVALAARGSRHRIFAIGVGSAAAVPLLRKLSDETGGACEIVTPREGMAERIVRQVGRMDARRLTGRIEWPAGATVAWPRSVDAVFAGDTVHAAAWFASRPSGQATLVTEDGEGAADRQTVDLGAMASPGIERIFAQVAAARRIAEMEEDEAATALAVRYGLLTAHTHLVMVAERTEKLGDLPELRRVPGMVAAGWMGNGTVMMSADEMPDRSQAVLPCFVLPADVPPDSARRISLLEKLALFGISPESAEAPGHGEPGDVIVRLRKALDEADLDRVDLAWLAHAGAPSGFCDGLRMLLSPEIDERVLVLALLVALASEAAANRLPRTITRRIRRAWAALGSLSPEKRSDLVEAIRAVASIDEWWSSALAG